MLLGFAIGAFFSLMSASFAYEDPMARASLTHSQRAGEIFKEMGRGMWSSGKGFGKVGALFAGIECVIESVRTLRTLEHDHDLTMDISCSIAPKTTWSTL